MESSIQQLYKQGDEGITKIGMYLRNKINTIGRYALLQGFNNKWLSYQQCEAIF